MAAVPAESPAQGAADIQTLLHSLVEAALADVATLERAGAQPVDARGSPSGGLAAEQLAGARRRATTGVVVLGHVSAAVVHMEGCSVRLRASCTCCRW